MTLVKSHRGTGETLSKLRWYHELSSFLAEVFLCVMIKLKMVDETTFDQVIELSLAEQDKRRVASNVYSLAQAWLLREKHQVFPHAIISGETVVGFLLLTKDRDKKEYYVWRLMIDQNYQNRGYGKEAMRWVIQIAQADPECHRLRVAYVMGNHRMRGILDSLEFKSSGPSGNEIVMTLDVK